MMTAIVSELRRVVSRSQRCSVINFRKSFRTPLVQAAIPPRITVEAADTTAEMTEPLFTRMPIQREAKGVCDRYCRSNPKRGKRRPQAAQNPEAPRLSSVPPERREFSSHITSEVREATRRNDSPASHLGIAVEVELAAISAEDDGAEAVAVLVPALSVLAARAVPLVLAVLAVLAFPEFPQFPAVLVLLAVLRSEILAGHLRDR